jgi:transposase
VTTRSSLQQPPINALANIEVQRLDHLGLVAATIESLRLVKRIDKRLPLKEDDKCKVTHGQRVKAMIINGLGYTNSPLYLTP